jgi:hypothetical protein
MRKNINGMLLAGVGGAALASVLVALLGDDTGGSRDSFERPTAMRSTELRPARESTESSAVAHQPAEAVESSTDAVPAVPVPATVVPGGRNPIVMNIPPTSRGTATDLPNRRDAEPDHARPADDLLNASRISCELPTPGYAMAIRSPWALAPIGAVS